MVGLSQSLSSSSPNLIAIFEIKGATKLTIVEGGGVNHIDWLVSAPSNKHATV